MATYWVEEQGAHIHKTYNRLVIKREGETVGEIPLHQCDQLLLRGNVQITTQALEALAMRKTEVQFLSRGGQHRFRLQGDEHRHAMLRLRQYDAVRDPSVTLGMVRRVVVGKLLNQRALLASAHGRGGARLSGATPNVQNALAGIPRLIDAAGRAPDADVARGHEGKGAALYWPAFRTCLVDDFGFTGRAYHPPPDALNALLSFAYSLLLKDVRAAVNVAGLDPYLGFFHTVQYGRPSLVLDLMEEFRPVAADALVLQLVNHAGLTRDDFATGAQIRPSAPASIEPITRDALTQSSKQAYLLKPPALRRVIDTYEMRLGTRINVAGTTHTLRGWVYEQARLFARVIVGDAREYTPFLGS